MTSLLDYCNARSPRILCVAVMVFANSAIVWGAEPIQGSSGQTMTARRNSTACTIQSQQGSPGHLILHLDIPIIDCEMTFPIGTDYVFFPSSVMACKIERFIGQDQDPLPALEAHLRDIVARISAGTYAFEDQPGSSGNSEESVISTVPNTFNLVDTLKRIGRIAGGNSGATYDIKVGARAEPFGFASFNLNQGDEPIVVRTWCLDESAVRRVWESFIAVKNYRDFMWGVKPAQ